MDKEKLDPTHVHHVNLLVRDLQTAKQQYASWFDVDFIDESLPSRGVVTARFLAGDTWIVLVQPVGEGAPMRLLREKGEGLFLLSLGVQQEAHTSPSLTPMRTGLSSWQVADVDPNCISNGQLQVTFSQTD
tara:strand:+ start:113 stop:505 length:393 start_codon:yes stop_codon:yes gene_type:complete